MALSLSLPPSPARAAESVTFDYFYDALAPYGHWIEVEGYGSCWSPSDVDPDWAPYTRGSWAYSDGGWTWVSEEDFGEIVFHYGRWVLIEDEGWCWVPGYEWAPAWVSWRNSDDYVGWAPLPPEASWRPHEGVGSWADSTYDIGPDSYTFCRPDDFCSSRMSSVILPRERNVFIIETTINVTNITYNSDDGVIFIGGPDYGYYCDRGSRHIPAYRLHHRTDLEFYEDGHHGRKPLPHAFARDGVLEIAAPRVFAQRKGHEYHPEPVKVVSKSKVSRGWDRLTNHEDREDFRRKVSKQVEGLSPKSAPARAVHESELKHIPNHVAKPLNEEHRPSREMDKSKGSERTQEVVTRRAIPQIETTKKHEESPARSETKHENSHSEELAHRRALEQKHAEAEAMQRQEVKRRSDETSKLNVEHERQNHIAHEQESARQRMHDQEVERNRQSKQQQEELESRKRSAEHERGKAQAQAQVQAQAAEANHRQQMIERNRAAQQQQQQAERARQSQQQQQAQVQAQARQSDNWSSESHHSKHKTKEEEDAEKKKRR
jgi:hypothetical protein